MFNCFIVKINAVLKFTVLHPIPPRDLTGGGVAVLRNMTEFKLDLIYFCTPFCCPCSSTVGALGKGMKGDLAQPLPSGGVTLTSELSLLNSKAGGGVFNGFLCFITECFQYVGLYDWREFTLLFPDVLHCF